MIAMVTGIVRVGKAGICYPKKANRRYRSSVRTNSLKLKTAEGPVTITLELKPEVEAALKAQAESAGLSLAQVLTRELEAIAPIVPAQSPEMRAGGIDQWEKELDEWLDSFPKSPVLTDEALSRENWYTDRW